MIHSNQLDPPSILRHDIEQVCTYLQEATEILRQVEDVTSLVLFGSYARDDYHEYSDVDFLIITETVTRRSDILSGLPASPVKDRLNLSTFTTTVFTAMYRSGAIFVRHVLTEGKILHDNGFLKALVAEPFPDSKQYCLNELTLVKNCLGLYQDLVIFDNHYRDMLLPIWRLARQAVGVGVALKGNPVYNKSEAIKRFVQLYPALKGDVAILRKLEPFSLLTQDRVKLPFDPTGATRQVKESLSSLGRIVQFVEQENSN
jgi:predicted nucleotidyltransferase